MNSNSLTVRSRSGRVDWRLVSAIDPDSVLRKGDISALQASTQSLWIKYYRNPQNSSYSSTESLKTTANFFSPSTISFTFWTINSFTFFINIDHRHLAATPTPTNLSTRYSPCLGGHRRCWRILPSVTWRARGQSRSRTPIWWSYVAWPSCAWSTCCTARMN